MRYTCAMHKAVIGANLKFSFLNKSLVWTISMYSYYRSISPNSIDGILLFHFAIFLCLSVFIMRNIVSLYYGLYEVHGCSDA